MADIGSLLVKIEADNKKILATLQQTNAHMEQFASNAKKHVGTASTSFDQMKAAVEKVAAALLLVKITDIGKDFQLAGADLKSFANIAHASLTELQADALTTGRAFGESATDVLKMYKTMATGRPDLLGHKQDLDQITKAAITLSKATGIDAKDAAELLSDSLHTFGKGTEDAANFVEILNTSTKYGTYSLTEMKTILERGGLAAKQSGLSFKDFVAIVQTVSLSGMKAREFTGAFTTTLETLEKQTENKFKPSHLGLASAINSVGYAHNKTAKEAAKITWEYQLQKDGTQKLVQVMVQAKDGQEILSNASDRLTKFLFENSSALSTMNSHLSDAGTASEDAANRQQTFADASHDLKASLENAAIVLSTKFLPQLTSGARQLEEWINTIGEAVQSNKDIDKSFNSLSDLIRGLTILLPTVGDAFKMAFSGIKDMLDGIISAISAVNIAFQQAIKLGVEFKQAGQSQQTVPGSPLDKLKNSIFGVSTPDADKSKIAGANESIRISKSVIDQAQESVFNRDTFGINGNPAGSGTTYMNVGAQQKQVIELRVTADKEGLINAVVNNQEFRNNVIDVSNNATKQAAQQVQE